MNNAFSGEVRHDVAVVKPKAKKPRLGRPPATDSADTRRRILAIAQSSFASLGYDGASNRVLGAEAELTAGAIYHYFGSKQELYAAVYEDVQARVFDRFEAAVAGQTSFRAQFEAVLDAAREMNLEDPSMAQFLGAMRVDVRRNAELRDALADNGKRTETFVRKIVDVGVKSGEIRPKRADQVFALVIALLVGLTDALSDDPERHQLAIDGSKALLAGTLLRPLR